METTSDFNTALSKGAKLALLLLMGASTTSAESAPRVLPEGALPNDVRLGPLNDFNGNFPFLPPKTVREWNGRAERVRRQILVSLGMWPMPAKPPLSPVVTKTIDRGDYTVENVSFESVPGFYVTGNLYRPKGKGGKLPAMLCPYGHWPDGRFVDLGPTQVLGEIAEGAERFEEGGRSLLQARCVQLARMGCVVFTYDMIGYGDATQIPLDLAHVDGDQGWVKPRPEMNTLENWGFYSPQAEAHLQSIMGLQAWDSIRALDFLLSLPDVDSERVGCSGASGGATQTLILAAIDDRLKVAFPAVMVSEEMQGGCSCENADGLRIGTGNVEFAALFAPKPLGMTCADDWTINLPTKGYPQLRQLYRLFGAEDRVTLTSLPQFKHNYNAVSRMAMYSWLNKQFRLGLAEPIVEKDYRRLTKEEATVWDAAHPPPAGGPAFERQLLRTLTADATKQLEALSRQPDEYRKIVGPAIDVLIGRNLDEVGQVQWNPKVEKRLDGHTEAVGMLRNVSHQEELPMVLLTPDHWNGSTVIWLEGNGKACLYAGPAGIRLKPEFRQLLDLGSAVVGVDLIYQGEFLAYGVPLQATRSVDNRLGAPAFTFCYNDSVFAQRVHDILTVIKFVKTRGSEAGKLVAVGLNGAGPLVAAAVPQARGAISGAVIAVAGFRFGNLLDVHDVNFLPGGARYGDLPGMVALAGTTPVVQIDNAESSAEPAIERLLR